MAPPVRERRSSDRHRCAAAQRNLPAPISAWRVRGCGAHATLVLLRKPVDPFGWRTKGQANRVTEYGHDEGITNGRNLVRRGTWTGRGYCRGLASTEAGECPHALNNRLNLSSSMGAFP